MSAFADLMTTTGIPAMVAAFGDSASYLVADTGATLATSAILSRDVSVLNGQTGMQELRTQIEIPSADLSTITPRRGDEIRVGLDRYLVQTRASDDGFLSRFYVQAGSQLITWDTGTAAAMEFDDGTALLWDTA